MVSNLNSEACSDSALKELVRGQVKNHKETFPMKVKKFFNCIPSRYAIAMNIYELRNSADDRHERI